MRILESHVVDTEVRLQRERSRDFRLEGAAPSAPRDRGRAPSGRRAPQGCGKGLHASEPLAHATVSAAAAVHLLAPDSVVANTCIDGCPMCDLIRSHIGQNGGAGLPTRFGAFGRSYASG